MYKHVCVHKPVYAYIKPKTNMLALVMTIVKLNGLEGVDGLE